MKKVWWIIPILFFIYLVYPQSRYIPLNEMLALQKGKVVKVNFVNDSSEVILDGTQHNFMFSIGRKSLLCAGNNQLLIDDSNIYTLDLNNSTVTKHITISRLLDYFSETEQVLFSKGDGIYVGDTNFSRRTYLFKPPYTDSEKIALKVSRNELIYTENRNEWWLLNIDSLKKEKINWIKSYECRNLIVFREKEKQIICKQHDDSVLVIDWGGKQKKKLNIDIPYVHDAHMINDNMLIYTTRRYAFPIGEKYQTVLYDFRSEKEYFVSDEFIYPIELCSQKYKK